MAKIRLTKEFRFEMAHVLRGYDGLCRNLHGHSYILNVTVIGVPCHDCNNPKTGMVMDFGELKNIVNSEIVNRLDHATLVSARISESERLHFSAITERLIVTDYQPTCENLLIDFAERIRKRLPPAVSLHSLKLNETASSYAQWFSEDNI
jgi:6-pyruvoyltetrahydropterin/6-carboxytetrahydropterin synthase